MTHILDNKNREKTVIALGYFDSVHIGHRKVLALGKELAKKLGAILVVLTFDGNLRAYLKGEHETIVYPKKEREKLLKEAGADVVDFMPVDYNLLSLGKLAFLNKINREYNVVGYVCGADYRFAKFAKGNASDIERYAKEKNQIALVVPDVNFNEKRVSTTNIKALLSDGKIEQANKLLGEPFYVCGKVYRDRGVGEKIGFPTANIKLDRENQTLKKGVYGGKVVLDGATFKAIINLGNRPTFDLEESVIEAHLLGFDGVLYDKEIKIEFIKYLRDVVKFTDVDTLKKQLEEDKISIGEMDD